MYAAVTKTKKRLAADDKERATWKYSYGEVILCPYELAVKELTVKFKHMIEEYHENDRYSPLNKSVEE